MPAARIRVPDSSPFSQLRCEQSNFTFVKATKTNYNHWPKTMNESEINPPRKSASETRIPFASSTVHRFKKDRRREAGHRVREEAHSIADRKYRWQEVSRKEQWYKRYKPNVLWNTDHVDYQCWKVGECKQLDQLDLGETTWNRHREQTKREVSESTWMFLDGSETPSNHVTKVIAKEHPRKYRHAQ